MYAPLQVNRFAWSILLVVQYRYLKSSSVDFYSPSAQDHALLVFIAQSGGFFISNWHIHRGGRGLFRFCLQFRRGFAVDSQNQNHSLVLHFWAVFIWASRFCCRHILYTHAPKSCFLFLSVSLGTADHQMIDFPIRALLEAKDESGIPRLILWLVDHVSSLQSSDFDVDISFIFTHNQKHQQRSTLNQQTWKAFRRQCGECWESCVPIL